MCMTLYYDTLDDGNAEVRKLFAELTINIVCDKKQTRYNDCGLFAIAKCTTFGRDCSSNRA